MTVSRAPSGRVRGAVVGGLAAAFGVKDRAIQRELPAAPAVRLGSKDHGVSFAAVRIGLVVFFVWAA